MHSGKKVFKNLFYSIGSQLILVAINIILPRLLIVSYGSDTNGLVSTITQIFSYIALLEAGIGAASVNRLYKNIAASDQAGISYTISATKKFFRNLIPVYALCVAGFMVIYPLIAKTNVPVSTICMIILFQGLSGIINFAFSNSLIQLLIADGRNYVSANLNLMSRCVSTVLQIILINTGFDIVIVQLGYLIANIIKAICLNIYVKKNYTWLTKVKNPDITVLEQRNAFIVHEISSVVFNNTDIVILSIFCGTKIVSVYTVYNMVYSMLNNFVCVFNNSMDYTLGQKYNKNMKEYLEYHDFYEPIYMAMIFSGMTIAMILMIPFVSIYMSGVNDINYIDCKLPILFSLIQVLSCSRIVCAKLITISGHAKNTVINTTLEAVINIVATLILVNFMGIYGALLGTIIALLYRSNDIIIYANTKVLHRKPVRTYKNLISNMIFFIAFAVGSIKLNLTVNGYWDFLKLIFLISPIVLLIYFGNVVVLNANVRNKIKEFILLIKRK